MSGSEQPARRDPIVIVDPDATWPAAFDAQAGPVNEALGPWLTRPIEHIGSTAVPGLAAKPIIDMLAVVADHRSVRDAFPALGRIGWVAAPEPGDTDHARWSWCFPTIEVRSHHLHIVEERSVGWPDWLLFRDYLRAHPQARADYGRLKTTLAEGSADDRPRYRAGKEPMIRALLAEAEAWRSAESEA